MFSKLPREVDMPYASNKDLPHAVRDYLPAHAQDIFRAAFNAAWRTYGSIDPARIEEIAHRVAWAAVKKRYRRLGDAWVPRQRRVPSVWTAAEPESEEE
jgi:cation transport regulator